MSKFNWKVEEMLLNKTKKESNDVHGYLIISYPIEKELSIDEKLEILNEYTKGKLNYFIELNNKYIVDKENGTIKSDSWGYPKENSKKAWIRKHDTDFVFWNGKTKDNSWTQDCFHYDFFGYGKQLYFGYSIGYDNVNSLFHDLCRYLEKKEIEYFKTHDEYEILKTRFRECGCPKFGVNIACWSSGDICIRNDIKDEQRPITIEELKILLEKYQELKEYEEKLKTEINIKF